MKIRLSKPKKIVVFVLVFMLSLYYLFNVPFLNSKEYILTEAQADFIDTIKLSYEISGKNVQLEDYNDQYAIIQVHDQNGRTKRHLLDINNEVVLSSDYSGNINKRNYNVAKANNITDTNYYTYNENLQITQIERPSMTYGLEYHRDNLSAEYINEQLVYKKSYNSFGQVDNINYGNSDQFTYVFNEQRERIADIFNGEVIGEYSYDGNNLASYKNNSTDEIMSFKYNEDGQISSVTYNTGFNITYSYDEEKEIKAKKYTIGNQSVELNMFDGQVISDNYSSIQESDIGDRITQNIIFTDSMQLRDVYNYEVEQLPEEEITDENYELHYRELNLNKLITSQSNNFFDFSYIYDDSNNLVEYSYGDNVYRFSYDHKNQLISCSANEFQLNYAYDESGNIIANEEKNYVYVEDKLIGEEFAYDAIGNPILYNGKRVTWNGKLMSQFGDVNYIYDNNGRRVLQARGNDVRKYYLDGNNVIFEERDGQIISYLYDLQGVVGLNINGNNYFYVKNIFRDIVGICDDKGELVVEYQYDPWGKIIEINGPDADTIGVLNPYRYRSYRYDDNTGLYYLNTRYYDCNMGRFLNCDSIGNLAYSMLSDDFTKNLYIYCNNNPINMSDPNGTMAVWALNLLKDVYSDLRILPDKWVSTPVLVMNGAGIYTAFHETAQLVAAKQLSSRGMVTELEYQTKVGEADILAYRGINYLYEVKPSTTKHSVSTAQLDKYIKATGFARGTTTFDCKIDFLPRVKMRVYYYRDGIINYEFSKEYTVWKLWKLKEVKKQVSESQVKKAISIGYWTGVAVAGAIVTATFVEDVATGGVGIANDVPSLGVAATAFRSALSFGMMFV